MDGVIEAVHIYDEHNNPILSHTYTGRPLAAAHLLPLYLDEVTKQNGGPGGMQPVVCVGTQPPTLVFGAAHGPLLMVATASGEVEPLLVLEFLHRVADALEAFLGSPLAAGRIEGAYDVAAQLLTEMCDAGTVGATTEVDALRERVAVEGLMGKLLGSITLPGGLAGVPGSSPSPSPAVSAAASVAQLSPALPWRRANVRHTSNELYADVVETLAVTLAPSGRPLAAVAQGSIAFTAKVSGVPEVCVSLSARHGAVALDGGSSCLLQLPVFHPCVRLAAWRQQPGTLRFVPPDGRFVLAAYEVDLLGSHDTPNNLRLPVSVEVRTSLGAAGADFEVRVHVHRAFFAPTTAGLSASSSSVGGRLGPHPGTPGAPLLEDVKVTVPLPAAVRNLLGVRPSRGDAAYSPGDRLLEWQVPAKEMMGSSSSCSLRCTVVGETGETGDADDDTNNDDNDNDDSYGFKTYSYDEPYQRTEKPRDAAAATATHTDKADAAAKARNKMLMPRSAAVSFGVRGWLASGVRVDSITLDTKRSRGLGEGVKPFKGVKYLTVSRGGVELRC